MSLKVLGISSGPRRDGNSDLLLKEALAGAAAAGAETEYLSLRGMKIGPCVECNACYKTGCCRIQDDYQSVFAKLLSVDRLVFASPIFFMAVCAQGKLLIDRNQCLWSRKYVLKQPLFPDLDVDRRALVIAVGGSRSKRMFESVYFTMKYYFDVLDMSYHSNLFVNGVDEKGEIREHPTAMQEALRLGGDLVSGPRRKSSRPKNVELFSE